MLYSRLLTYIATEEGTDGPIFERNKITHLYEEVIQASRGSRWVWALTFASSIEAIVTLLIRHGVKHTGANLAGIEELAEHIGKWPGDASLRSVAIGAVKRTAETTTKKALDVLIKEGVIDKSQQNAWLAIRSAVMHGSLVSQYSTEKEDGQLLALANMLHALTRELVRKATTLPTPA